MKKVPKATKVILANRKAPVDFFALGQIREGATGRLRLFAKYSHCACVRLQHADQRPQQRRFAASVWPDYRGHRPAGNLPMNVRQNRFSVVGDRHSRQFYAVPGLCHCRHLHLPKNFRNASPFARIISTYVLISAVKPSVYNTPTGTFASRASSSMKDGPMWGSAKTAGTWV